MFSYEPRLLGQRHLLCHRIQLQVLYKCKYWMNLRTREQISDALCSQCIKWKYKAEIKSACVRVCLIYLQDQSTDVDKNLHGNSLPKV
jgi:hypothetical protein